MSDIPILGAKPDETGKTTEVCRSFAYKLNLANHGGPPYESADFFSSRKMECATEAAEWVSEQIYEECVTEVRECVARFLDDMKRRQRERARAPERMGA